MIPRGLYQIRPDLPYVVGAEDAGEVIEVGADVANVAPGDRVAFFHLTGAFAEELLTKHWRVIALPDGALYDTAAATLHNYVTAAYALRERAGLQIGETLVVYGATGASGLAAGALFLLAASRQRRRFDEEERA